MRNVTARVARVAGVIGEARVAHAGLARLAKALAKVLAWWEHDRPVRRPVTYSAV